MLKGLEALGNAGVIPIVIFLTQIIKKKVGSFRYGSDIIALFLSFILCTGWTFYNMSPADFQLWSEGTSLFKFKHGIDQLIIGFATWFSASKIYDLGHGNKKRGQAVSTQLEIHMSDKIKLQEEIVKLKNGGGDTDGQTQEDPIISNKLREILEG
jgi:hypothetical protein